MNIFWIMRKIAILQVYDADAQMTRNRIENILEAGYISEEDIDFSKSDTS